MIADCTISEGQKLTLFGCAPVPVGHKLVAFGETYRVRAYHDGCAVAVLDPWVSWPVRAWRRVVSVWRCVITLGAQP